MVDVLGTQWGLERFESLSRQNGEITRSLDDPTKHRSKCRRSAVLLSSKFVAYSRHATVPWSDLTIQREFDNAEVCLYCANSLKP